jgi:hypothetical protein
MKLLLLLAVALVPGCVDRPVTATATATSTSASTSASTSTPTPTPTPSPPPHLADEDLGPLIARLSEAPGDFPSDNFVSNETSYLDVAASLGDPALRGRAYVGVGPEQNYTYIALTEPAVAYIVDLRRGNLLEHLVLRGCFEAGETRAGFLSALLARRPRGDGTGAGDFAPLAAAFASSAPEPSLLQAGVARSRAVLDRLHVVRAPGDDEGIARIHAAFAARGLSLAFEMKNSGLPFPSLGEVLATRSPDGAQGSFLASEERYRRVRALVLANRVVPVVGDFGGRHALAAVAADVRARGLLLGVFYASNVEQYLFDAGTHGAFVDGVRAMPRDDASLLVRVWLDPLRPHPLQRRGHRTTTLAVRASAFLASAAARPYASYWDVVTRGP